MERNINISLVAVDKEGLKRNFIKDSELAFISSTKISEDVLKKVIKLSPKNFDSSKEFERGKRNKQKKIKNYNFLISSKFEKVKKKITKTIYKTFLDRTLDSEIDEHDGVCTDLAYLLSYIEVIESDHSKENLFLWIEREDGSELFSKKAKEKDEDDDEDKL